MTERVCVCVCGQTRVGRDLTSRDLGDPDSAGLFLQ